ncbi:MAG: PIN domain-containing protein [Caldilineales bacterium]|nr:PIN domain-containing protein [Caldilineales bacterium]
MSGNAMPDRPRIFLDSGALLSGFWPGDEAARGLLRLGELGAVQLVVDGAVLGEVEAVLRQYAPRSLSDLAFTLDQSGFQIVALPDPVLVRACLKLVPERDAAIVAAAWSAQVSYFVTLEKSTLVHNVPLRGLAPFEPGTPADCLRWWRQQLVRRFAGGY